MFKVGDTVNFVIGLHVNVGVVVDTHPIAFHGGTSLLVQVREDVFELVYADEAVLMEA